MCLNNTNSIAIIIMHYSWTSNRTLWEEDIINTTSLQRILKLMFIFLWVLKRWQPLHKLMTGPNVSTLYTQSGKSIPCDGICHHVRQMWLHLFSCTQLMDEEVEVTLLGSGINCTLPCMCYFGQLAWWSGIVERVSLMILRKSPEAWWVK